MEATVKKPKIFISYARSDSAALAEELVAGLELAGFTAFVDRHDIAAAEDWEAWLGALILSADTVVFIISPAAVVAHIGTKGDPRYRPACPQVWFPPSQLTIHDRSTGLCVEAKHARRAALRSHPGHLAKQACIAFARARS